MAYPKRNASMPEAKLIVTVLALTLVAACQQASSAIDRTVGPGASTSTLTPADAEFVLRAADSSNAEIALGELAQENAGSPAVKAFAREMVAEHTRLNEELTAIATREGLSPPSTPTAPAAAVAAALDTRTGAAFDRAYLTQQIAAHDLTLALFRHAAENAEDASVQSFARAHADEIEEHMEEAERLLRGVAVGT
jgi:putative membrane protein